MEGVIGGVLSRVLNAQATRVRTPEKTGSEILAQMKTVRVALEAAASRFNYVTDPDMVDSCIYEMQALGSRYRHLLRVARQMHLSRPALPAAARRNEELPNEAPHGRPGCP